MTRVAQWCRACAGSIGPWRTEGPEHGRGAAHPRRGSHALVETRSFDFGTISSHDEIVPKSFTLLLAATTGFEGFRFGAGTFRVLLDLPARHQIGAVSFAAFSRATDLSPRGIAIYVMYGLGGAALTGLTWFTAGRAKAPTSIRRLCAIAFACSILILLFTTQAAPLMFRVGASEDAQALATLLDRFTVWTNLRVACADVSFVCMLSALSLLALRQPRADGATVP